MLLKVDYAVYACHRCTKYRIAKSCLSSSPHTPLSSCDLCHCPSSSWICSCHNTYRCWCCDNETWPPLNEVHACNHCGFILNGSCGIVWTISTPQNSVWYEKWLSKERTPSKNAVYYSSLATVDEKVGEEEIEEIEKEWREHNRMVVERLYRVKVCVDVREDGLRKYSGESSQAIEAN